MNKVFLIGRLTQDPTASTLDSGHTYCRFSIAVNRFTRGEDSRADFINIVTWDALAQNCVKYLAKGSKVAVCGSIQTGSYERDGVKRQTFEIRAEQVEFLGSRSGAAQGQTTQARPSRDQAIDSLQEVSDDDMPF